MPALASSLVGALDGLMLQLWLNPDLDAGHYFESFMAVLFQGMDPPTEKGEDP